MAENDEKAAVRLLDARLRGNDEVMAENDEKAAVRLLNARLRGNGENVAAPAFAGIPA